MMRSIDLEHVPWIARQPASLRDAIMHSGRAVCLSAGQTVFLQGDDHTGLWIVLGGIVRLEMTLGSTRDALVALVPPGEVFGRSQGGGAINRIVSARAARDVKAFVLADHAIARIGAEQPAMWLALAQATQSQLDATALLLAHIIGLPPRARLAARLLAIAKSLASNDIPVTQDELAEMTGLSRKTVNLHLRALGSHGMISTGRGTIVVTDTAALTALIDDASM